MAGRTRHASASRKRRTTLTLPADSLLQAEKIARARKVNLSVVVSEALDAGLRQSAASGRSDRVLRAYQIAFADFSTEELALLDGIILEPVAKR